MNIKKIALFSILALNSSNFIVCDNEEESTTTLTQETSPSDIDNQKPTTTLAQETSPSDIDNQKPTTTVSDDKNAKLIQAQINSMEHAKNMFGLTAGICLYLLPQKQGYNSTNNLIDFAAYLLIFNSFLKLYLSC